MDDHIVGLPDAIQPPDPLLQQVGILWQVKANQVMGELEITPLTADFRTYQSLGATHFVGKVGRCTVTLNKCQPFMEGGTSYARAQMKIMFQGQCGLGMGGDNQNL